MVIFKKNVSFVTVLAGKEYGFKRRKIYYDIG